MIFCRLVFDIAKCFGWCHVLDY